LKTSGARGNIPTLAKEDVAMPRSEPKYQIDLTPQQVDFLMKLSRNYTAPFASVQRARILLLAHERLSNAEIARRVGCCQQTVRNWRRRWSVEPTLSDAVRSGCPRRLTPTERAAITALACSSPQHHNRPFKRWSGEKLAQVAREEKLLESISPSTVRRFLREEKIKPWRYHSWQKSSDPDFVPKAAPVLDLYESAQEDADRGELSVCIDEKTSIQARQRVDKTLPAKAGLALRVADRYKRCGALQLFCALAVATGLTFTRTFARKCFAQMKEFLLAFFTSTLCQGIKVLNLILDNGPTHAPKQMGNWIAGLELRFEVRIFWLPKYASWLDQVEIIFSKLQRDLLKPNDFASTQALERDLSAYFAEINKNPKPIQWTYTKAKMMKKFAPP
jgi:transposase